MEKISGCLKRIVGNIKLKWKMTIVWLTSVAVVLLFSVWGNINISRSYNDVLYSVMVDSMNYAVTDISGQLEQYEILGENIFRNMQIQENLSEIQKSGKAYSVDYEDIRSQVIKESTHYQYINDIVLLNERTGSVFGTATSLGMNSEKIETIVMTAKERGRKSVWITEYGKESQMILTRTIPSIENLGRDTLATLIINIDIAAMIRDTGISKQKNFRCVLVDKEGNSLSDSGKYSNGQIKNIYEQIRDEQFAVATVEGQKYFAIYREESNESWGYVHFTEYDAIFSEIHRNINHVILAGLICALLIVALNSIFTRDILQRFGGLIQAFQDFAEDISKPHTREYSGGMDEIGTLYRQFDLMQEKVVRLIRENYVIELERKRTQVEMLETQINPHFLYNTLQTIAWRAKVLRSREISEMVEALSQILQITLSNKKSFITVEEELFLVEQFITIQRMRMEDELIYEVSAEPELLDEMIPKLIIQPLVENGISHSMDALLEHSCVLVNVRRENENLAIYVKNNGSRFPENFLVKLNNKEIHPVGHGIGIMNIVARIKLTYGEAYGIVFYNEGEYAVAKLLLPCYGEEDVHV